MIMGKMKRNPARDACCWFLQYVEINVPRATAVQTKAKAAMNITNNEPRIGTWKMNTATVRIRGKLDIPRMTYGTVFP
jgi:hypothetical protein